MIKILLILFVLVWVFMKFKVGISKIWLAFFTPFFEGVTKKAEKNVVEAPLTVDQINEVRK